MWLPGSRSLSFRSGTGCARQGSTDASSGRALLTQLASLPFIAAGVSILRSGSWVGFYLIALAVVFSFLLAFLNTWILVIEISR